MLTTMNKYNDDEAAGNKYFKDNHDIMMMAIKMVIKTVPEEDQTIDIMMLAIIMMIKTVPEVYEEDSPPTVNHLQRQTKHQLGIDDNYLESLVHSLN